MHSKAKGNTGQAAVVYDLLRQNFRVFTEFGDLSRIDIIVEKENQLYKIQVKALKAGSDGSICLKSTKSGPNYKFRYKLEDIDVFAIYSLDTTEIGYVSAKEFLNHHSTMNFRIRNSKNNQLIRTRFLAEYADVERALRDCTQSTQTSNVEGEEPVQTTTSN